MACTHRFMDSQTVVTPRGCNDNLKPLFRFRLPEHTGPTPPAQALFALALICMSHLEKILVMFCWITFILIFKCSFFGKISLLQCTIVLFLIARGLVLIVFHARLFWQALFGQNIFISSSQWPPPPPITYVYSLALRDVVHRC